MRLRDGEVTIRPIAGTRKRGATPAEDRELAQDLLNDPKEISEHLMLLDLGRNDVGRVSRPGTVETTDEMNIENYSHVMHIVSNVTGQLDTKYDVLSALMAGFPAGTVSGAPKIRAMEIIDDLENQRRSFYAGCIGYFSGSGNLDTCIALRTALVKDGMLHIQAGAGIVAESDPDSEYAECAHKERALMRAAEEASKFCMNIILLDNYDSFTYNLLHYIAELGAQVTVYRNDVISTQELLAKKPDGIVISPGPGTPSESGICLELVKEAAGNIPLLGVCLGHQAIAEAFGGKIVPRAQAHAWQSK